MAIATLTIDIQAKLANIERDLGRVAQQSEATAKRMEEAFGKAAAGMTAVREAAVAAVSAMATGAFAAWVQHAIDGADAFNDLAERTGIAASNLSAYAYAAKLSGTDIEGLGAGLKAFSKSVTEGNEAFKAMGVSTKDAAGHLRGTDQILEDVADKFSGYADGAAKSALAMQLFGKAGVELIPFLDNGKQGLADLRQEAESLGAVLDERTIKAAGDFNDNLDRLRAASSGYAAKLFGELSPALATVTDSMLGTAKQSGDLQIIIDGLAVSIKGLITAGYGVGAVFDQIGTSLGAVSAAAVQAMQGNFKQAGDILEQNGADFNTRSEAWASKMADVWAKVPQEVSNAVNEAAKNAGKGNAPIVDDTAKKAAEASAKLEEAYSGLVKSLQTKLVEQQQGTELDKLEIELAQKKLAGLSNYQREVLRSYAKQIDTQKLLRIEATATAKAIEEAGKRQSDTLKGLQDDLDRATRELQTYGKTRSEIADMDVAALQQQVDEEERLNAEIGVAGSGYLDYLRQQLQLRKQIAGTAHQLDAADEAKKASDAAKEAAKETQQRWQKTVDDINDTFRQGFRAALDKNGNAWENWCDNLEKTFKTAVADQIYKMFAEPIVVQLVGSLSGLSGLAGTAASAASGSGGASGTNQFASGLNMLSNLKTMYSAYSGGLASTIGGYVAGAGNLFGSASLSAYGTGMGLTSSQAAAAAAAYNQAGMTGVATNLTAGSSAGAGVAAWSGPAMAIVAGILANINAYNSGFRYERQDSNAVFGDKKQFAGRFADWLDSITPGFLNSSEFAHKLVSNVIGDTNNLLAKITGSNKMAAVLSGSALHEKLFGHGATNADAGGLSGTIDLSGLTGQMWQDFSQRGGWFRSDNRWTEQAAVAPDLQNIIDSTVKSSVAGVKAIGAQLGIAGEEALKGFQHTFNLQLTGENGWDDALNRIQAELGKVSDELAAKLVPNIADFGQMGETASQTLQRLSQELSATDVILQAMGKTAAEAFGATGLASVKARENLIALAGGLDALSNKTQFYYQTFYSEQERVSKAGAQAAQQVNTAFAEMGLAVPATREAFRALVESELAAGESGQKLFVSLLNIAPAFEATQVAADAVKKALDEQAAKQAEAANTVASLIDKYGSEADKLAKAQASLVIGFAAIGQSVPKTAAEFLALARSADPATAAGQKLIAALDGLSGAFETAVIGAQNAAASAYFANVDTTAKAAGYLQSGQAALDQIFGSLSTGAQQAAQSASDAANAWRSAADQIKSTLDRVRGGDLSQLSPEARYNLLKAQFATTSIAAQAGDKDAAAKLSGIATDFLDASKNYNASSEQYFRDLQNVDQGLSKTLDFARSQTSLQETIANAARATVDQLSSLNGNLTGFAKQALELLQKGYTGADRATANDAVGKLAKAQSEFDKWFATTKEGSVTRSEPNFGSAFFTRLSGDMASFTGADGVVSYLRATESILDIAKRIPELRADWEKQYGIKLPSYAVGTPYVQGDQVAQIHHGEMVIDRNTSDMLRRYGISGGGAQDQSALIDELRASRGVLSAGFATLQQQLASANARLAAVEKRLAAVEDQSRLSRAGMGV